jgi:hypothetical protein
MKTTFNLALKVGFIAYFWFIMELEEFKCIKKMLNYLKLLAISVSLSSLYTATS